MWESFEEAKWAAVKENATDKISKFITDPSPEANQILFSLIQQVRCAALYALGLFFGGADGNDQRKHIDFNIALSMLGIMGIKTFY